MLLGAGAVVTYGFYRLAQGLRERNELSREKVWSRIHLIPVLQAEEDRDQVRRWHADQTREKELMGENTRVYHSDRYVSRRIEIGIWGWVLMRGVALCVLRLRLSRRRSRSKMGGRRREEGGREEVYIYTEEKFVLFERIGRCDVCVGRY
jgi:GRIM-19 protein